MQYFTEQAFSHIEALEKIRMKYGEQAKVLTQRNIRLGGFLGMFARDGVELSGYIAKNGKRNLPNVEAEKQKQKILKSVQDDQTLQKLLKEVQSIKETIETPNIEPAVTEEHETLTRIEELLDANDFTRPYTRAIIARLKREATLDELEDFRAMQDRVVDWIADSIRVFEDSIDSQPKLFVLVGPTGVGKTTTIAKLAAVYGLGAGGKKAKSVRMITIDNYRIGAKQQIETYGDIMGIPVTCVENNQDLRKQLALYHDIDLVLVDTIGKSPKDYMKLAEMRELLDACGSRAEVFLALSATTKTADLGEILQQFEPFNYKAVVLTKLDETMHLGNIISVLAEKHKPIAYVTDGQVVPQDIEAATVTRMLMHLDGFHIDQQRFDDMYGSTRVTGQVNYG
jgi:flagellar biosynthesis protein FlhF